MTNFDCEINDSLTKLTNISYKNINYSLLSNLTKGCKSLKHISIRFNLLNHIQMFLMYVISFNFTYITFNFSLHNFSFLMHILLSTTSLILCTDAVWKPAVPEPITEFMMKSPVLLMHLEVPEFVISI